MIEIEDQINEWIKFDPRRVNPPSYGNLYPITNNIILARMKIMLPPQLISGKRILDLGCGIPYNELWCNRYNAELYHGVEVQKELAEKGSSLVSNNNKVFYDILLKINKSNMKSFEMNFKLISSYFMVFDGEKCPKYIEFSNYFSKFYKYCFGLPLDNMLSNLLNFKY